MSSKICLLMSCMDFVPNQKIFIGDQFVVGRNPICAIRDLKCSRFHLRVAFDGHHVDVTQCKDGRKLILANGDFIEGPGFRYKIVFVSESGHNQQRVDDNNFANQSLDEKSKQKTKDKSLNEQSFNDESFKNDKSLNDESLKDKSLNDESLKDESLKDKSLTDKSLKDESLKDDNRMQAQELVLPTRSDSTFADSGIKWESLESGHVHVCWFMGGGKPSSLIAAFDFDGTLVEPKSGNKFPVDGNDWRLFDRSLPNKISKLVKDGYRFVVISNQMGLSQGRNALSDIKKRFEGALNAIGFPCLVLIAANDDKFRKPRPGLWQILQKFSPGVEINVRNSFFVGDAAGRKSKLKSDHSAGDILFAVNLNLPFNTPEQFIRDQKPKIIDFNTETSYKVTCYRPVRNDSTFIATKIGSETQYETVADILNEYAGKTLVVVFCGLPASGKSTFYANYFSSFNFSYISRDALRTMEKCEKEAEKSLARKQGCVIDNTNVDASSRSRWILLCRRYASVPLLFYFNVHNVQHALHNNIYRRIVNFNSPVTELVIRSQNKNFIKPTIHEGFDAIFKINFVPKFPSDDYEKLYYMYLAER